MLRTGLRAHRVEAAAALVGALLALVAVLAVRTGAARDPNHHTAAARRTFGSSRRPRAAAQPDTRAAAVVAATTYLLSVGNAAVGDPMRARRVAGAVATGPLRQQLEQALPALAASIRARVKAGRAPAAFDGWPLGYHVLAFNRSEATVAVWHLDVAASSALDLMSVDYATTTYRLRFLTGEWRIVQAATAPGPTPPRTTRPGLDGFARASDSFSTYRYVP